MRDNRRQPDKSKSSDQPEDESATAFPKSKDKAVEADPLKHREPEPKKPGERLEDYLG
jgi:hypothetical protein